MNSNVAAFFPEMSAISGESDATACGEPVMEWEHSCPACLENDSGAHGQKLFEAIQSDDLSDELLLQRTGHGDRDSLTFLFRRHAASIRHVGYRILRNRAEADDLLQDVFLFLSRRAALFDPSKSSAKSWIIQMAYHRAFDRRRYLSARHFYRAEELKDEVLNPSRDGDTEQASVDGITGRELLARFHDLLSSVQLQTLELFFFQGYALKEIAEMTNQTLVNVRNHYYRGLGRLRSHLLAGKVQPK